MKVLLVGEYSGVHSNLAKILIDKGCEVTTVSDGDGYKNFPRDLDLLVRDSFFTNSRTQVVLDFLGVNGLFSYFKRRKEIDCLKGYDVVQLINPAPISCYSSLANYLLVKQLNKNNKNIFLCALGDDYFWVKLCLSGKLKYSPLDRLSLLNFKSYLFSLKYVYGLGYKYLNKYVVSISKQIIPGLTDYKKAYDWCEKTTSVVGIVIDDEQLEKTKKLLSTDMFARRSVISIFHGWQKGKDLRKGNDILDVSMKKLILKYGERISYKIVSGLTYNEYLQTFEQSDIYLDQIYSYDRGVNAIIGMANGKLVVSGFEDFITGDSLITEIGINGSDETEKLEKAIGLIIEDDDKRIQIIKNSLKYIIDNHSPNVVYEKYMEIWRFGR